MIGELFSPSEYSYLMNDLKDCPNLEDVGVGQLLDPLEVYNLNTNYDKPTIKKRRHAKMCDSTMKPSTSTNEALPCLITYPGPYDFQLFLPDDNTTHRWAFSKPLNKVFIDIEKVLALKFRWNHYQLKPDVQLYVRALPVYTSPDWMKIAVSRCPLHILPDNSTNAGFPFVEHVIRCEHSNTQYEKDEVSHRLSCVTPLSYPQAGSDSTTLTYKFVCKTSCPSGMDRKPISVIFTLEDCNGIVYGRQLLAVKICSCPKRDKHKEEKNELEKASSSHITRSRSSTTDTVTIRNSRGASTSNAEQLKDLQPAKRGHKVITDTTGAASSTSSESDSATPTVLAKHTANGGRPSTSGVSLKKSRRCACSNNAATNNDQLIAMIKDLPNEIVSKMNSRNDSAFEIFGRSIAAQLEELPSQYAYELQVDFQKMILMKRIQAQYSQQNACLTPAPSLASPEPNTDTEGHYRTPSTPTYVKMWTNL